jgi:hypothetical protein
MGDFRTPLYGIVRINGNCRGIVDMNVFRRMEAEIERLRTALEDFVNCFVPQTEAEKLCFEQAKQALEQE